MVDFQTLVIALRVINFSGGLVYRLKFLSIEMIAFLTWIDSDIHNLVQAGWWLVYIVYIHWTWVVFSIILSGMWSELLTNPRTNNKILKTYTFKWLFLAIVEGVTVSWLHSDFSSDSFSYCLAAGIISLFCKTST